MVSIGAANLDAAGAPDDLFSLASRCRLRRTVFSWEEVGARVRRAPWRARLRVTGAGCSRALGFVELPGPPQTTRRHSRNRNLQLRGSLAQSHRRICFIPDDEGIVVPVCVADIPGGLEPGSAARLPKAVVHLHNSGINALLHPSVARIHPGQQTASCGTHLQRQRPDNNLRQNTAPSTHATACLAEPST